MGPGDMKNKPAKISPNDQEVKEKIAETLEQLTSKGKSKSAKIRREKRQERKERALEAIKAESIVQLEMNQFREWWRTQAVIPTIKSIRNHVESVRKNETSRSLNKLSELSDEQREVIEKLTKSIVTKILDQPTRKLKDRNDQRLTQAARELFEINDDSYLT